jgi:hypothetical protein
VSILVSILLTNAYFLKKMCNSAAISRHGFNECSGKKRRKFLAVAILLGVATALEFFKPVVCLGDPMVQPLGIV